MSGTPENQPRPSSITLRLYISRSTPNSMRAEQNLLEALAEPGRENTGFILDIIDVFANGKRAIKDGVIVTPTLIVLRGDQRFTIVGDLSDRSRLHLAIGKITSAEQS